MRKSPYLGKWHGRFAVTELERPREIGLKPEEWSYRADLQVYVRKFELRLDGPQQGVVVKGTYEIREAANGGRGGITLHPTETKIDDFGGAEKRDPNRPYYPNEATTAFFAKEIPLRLTPEKKLNGVPDRWGRATGRLEFSRDE